MNLLLSLNILKSGVIILNVDNGFQILERYEKKKMRICDRKISLKQCKQTRHTFIDYKSYWLSSVRLLCSYLRAVLVSCRNGHMWLRNWGTWTPRSESRCRCSTDEFQALRSGPHICEIKININILYLELIESSCKYNN